jgi:methylphosphotriester-DNA--protein-cysteine methyltransferase
MNPRNYARLYKQELGKTPAKHIEDLRLEAARRLESTSRSTDEVADACGLASAESSAACPSDACTSHLVNIERHSGELDCAHCLRSIGRQES